MAGGWIGSYRTAESLRESPATESPEPATTFWFLNAESCLEQAAANLMSVYGLPLICKQSVFGRHSTTAYVYPASKGGIHSLMPGHNGLFARQLPIAFSYFKYVEVAGFH